MCYETDFTQEKVNFHATTEIPNSSSYYCCLSLSDENQTNHPQFISNGCMQLACYVMIVRQFRILSQFLHDDTTRPCPRHYRLDVTLRFRKYTVREKGPIKKALSADFNPDTFILTEKNGEPLHETTFLNLDYNNLFSQTLKRTHPIAMHSTSPENEENILFWQWIVRTKILFTASKGSWSKTVWRIISAKVCEHLLDIIFSPY